MVFSAIPAVDGRCMPLLCIMTGNSGHSTEGHQPECRELSAKTVGDDSLKHQQGRRTLIQMLRVMRIIAVLLLAAVLQVSARTEAQTVTYSAKAASLQQVFNAVKKQTGYFFFYRSEDLAGTAPVTVELNEVPLQKALTTILAGQPLDFEIQGNTVVISAREKIGLRNNPTLQTSKDSLPLRGMVFTETRQPLSGATVVVKGSKKMTLTNARGEFLLPGMPVNGILQVSFVGYTTREVTVADLQQVLMITLNVAVDELDQAVVQAYGTTSARLSTGNIVKVTAAEIERQPVMNPLLALQGRVPGLEVTQINGYASAPVKVELRGRNTINDNFTSDPLYIIDGVPLTVLELNKGSNYDQGSRGFIQSGINGPANGQSPLFSLNPLDIESIEVLKDADATAIYGSRGANGVILITTKKGRAGKTQLDLRVTQGITRVTKFWHLMNTQQYLQMRREAYKNDGLAPTPANGAYDLLQWDTTKYTDWQKAIYDGTGKATNVQAGLSGGDSYNTFRIDADYNRITNILTVSGADQRLSLSLGVGHSSRDHRFSLNLSAAYSYTRSDMISINPAALTLPPNAPPIYDSLGNLNYSGWGGQNSAGRRAFIFAGLKNPYVAKTYFLNSGLVLNYEPFKGLKISTNIGYGTSQSKQTSLTTIASQDPLANRTGTSQYGLTISNNWIVEPTVSYETVLGKGKITVMGGGSIQHTVTEGYILSGSGYTSDDLLNVTGAAPVQAAENSSGQYKYAAVFGRINYNFENKYILSLNGRRDGSSRFGSGNQFGNFGSIGGAWIFSEENWFKKNRLSFISFGKLRASYGITGGDAVGDYGYLSRWSYPGYQFFLYDGNRVLLPTQHYNPYFHWQANKKLEGGIELGFLKDRIRINVVYYRNRCGNQLLNFPTPLLSGFPTVIANSPALVQNSGWEFSFSSRVIESKNFKWSISFNTAINKNVLLAYANFSQSPYANKLEIGKPLNIVKQLKTVGVDPLTGLYVFEDRNKDGIVTINSSPINDRYWIDKTPKFLGGLGMNFSYKNLQVNMYFNIKKQIGVNGYLLTGSTAGNAKNQPVEIIGKEWQKPGDIATSTKFGTRTSNGLVGNSDLTYTDASFIRFSSLAISYSLPANYLKKIGIAGCNLFINTNNLFVITKYKGLDPETQNFGGMPPSKTIVGGVSFNF